MHLYCVPKPSGQERVDCIKRASSVVAPNIYETLGFFYSSFLIEAAVHETFSSDRKFPRAALDQHADVVRIALKGLQNAEDATFIRFEQLCGITGRDCVRASALHHIWNPTYYLYERKR